MRNKLVFENLRQRPVRTCLRGLAIGVEVTMMLTHVGISYVTLHEAARRARGVGARQGDSLLSQVFNPSGWAYTYRRPDERAFPIFCHRWAVTTGKPRNSAISCQP